MVVEFSYTWNGSHGQCSQILVVRKSLFPFGSKVLLRPHGNQACKGLRRCISDVSIMRAVLPPFTILYNKKQKQNTQKLKTTTTHA